MQHGINEHPSWYPGLSRNSRFEEFQQHFHEKGLGDCQKPCPHECLCIFDIDRTLTGKQSDEQCPANEQFHNVWDNAYGGGDLALSEFGQNVCKSFCGECRLGVVSHGTAGGDTMKNIVLDQLSCNGHTLPNEWSYPHHIHSPLVLGCANKSPCVEGVVNWYENERVHISKNDVYFFDDRRDNVEAVGHQGYNARQISCSTRGGSWDEIGGCGAELKEITRDDGTFTC